MKVIKKDGRLQEFSIKKIETSLGNAAEDSKTILNESDLNILLEDIQKTVVKLRKDDGITSSYEIVGTIFEMLKRDGFNSILKSYIQFQK